MRVPGRASLEDVNPAGDLEEAQTRFAALDAVPAGLCLLRDDSVVLFWNRCLEGWSGIARERIVGRPVGDEVPGLREIIEAGRLRDVFAGGPASTFSAQLHKQLVPSLLPNGEPRIQQGMVTAVASGHAGRYYALLSVQDVTDETRLVGEHRRMRDQVIDELKERRKTEEALLVSEGRYRSLFERNPAGVYRTRPDGHILECNPASARLLGFDSADELKAYGKLDFYLDPAEREKAARLLQERKQLSEVEIPFRRKDGSVGHAVANLQLLEDNYGAPVIEGTFIDVTEHRRFEERLRQAQKLEAVGQMAGGIAHDFNNHLNVVIGYGELLLRRPPSPEQVRTKVGEMIKAAGKAAKLTRQLLIFGRKQIVQPRVLNVCETVAETGRMLQRLIGDRIQLDVVCPPEPCRVQADGSELEQVVVTLALNARDAMPNGGRLRIEVASVALDAEQVRAYPPADPGRYVVVSVTDTGTGIPPEVRSRIFEPFFTTKGPGEGTGLGLAAVYGIVRQGHGFVAVETDVGRGTTFRIGLPLVAEPSSPRGELAPAPSLCRGKTLLVVEDEQAVRELIGEILSSWECHVLEAKDGVDALAIAEAYQGPIHAVLTDVVMPRLTGPELARRLKTVRPDLRVLYMSGYTEDALLRNGVAEHGVSLLQKPFTPAELEEKLHDVLDAPSTAE